MHGCSSEQVAASDSRCQRCAVGREQSAERAAEVVVVGETLAASFLEVRPERTLRIEGCIGERSADQQQPMKQREQADADTARPTAHCTVTGTGNSPKSLCSSSK